MRSLGVPKLKWLPSRQGGSKAVACERFGVGDGTGLSSVSLFFRHAHEKAPS